MKWINHKVSTFSLVFILTQDLISSIVAAGGSVIPDALEGHDYKSERWRKNHRRTTHWLLGYLILAVFLLGVIYLKTEALMLSTPFIQFVKGFKVFNSETLIFVALFLGFYVILGCILHVLQDALSSPVPFLHPKKRTFSIGIMRVGSLAEYLLSFGLLIFAVLIIK